MKMFGKRTKWFGFTFLITIITGVKCGSVSNMIELACKRNPNLLICKTQEIRQDSLENINRVMEAGVVLNDESFDISNTTQLTNESFDNITMPLSTAVIEPSTTELPSTAATQNITATTSPVTNTKDSKSHISTAVTKSQFIRLRSYASSVEQLDKNPFISHTKTSFLEQSKENYCHKYVPKFTFYCQGPGRLTVAEKEHRKLAAFCFSVKNTCFPEQMTPCTPDCNERIHSHCTASCKCDYLYPLIIKFCSPLSMPFLENVCRSWFVGCSKMYELDVFDIDTFLFPSNVKSRSVWIKDDVLLPETKSSTKSRPRIHQAKNFPIQSSDSEFGSGSFHKFDQFTDQGGVLHRPRSRSPWSKPGLWEANPDNPHNRDHANKWYYAPRSVTADWLSGQIFYGAHWAVPAAGVGGTDGFSAIHFPTIGNFLNIADDYD